MDKVEKQQKMAQMLPVQVHVVSAKAIQQKPIARCDSSWRELPIKNKNKK